MPEIKNQFTGGKMNKDIDERLMPKGEYRDAMNIQVATSEDSEVGTAQNILGNTHIFIQPKNSPAIPFPVDAVVVGSIADEKVDTLYWFVWTAYADYIVKYERKATTPEFVFIDVNKSCLKFDPSNIITGINIIDGMLFWTDNQSEPKKINILRSLQGTIVPTVTSSGAISAQQTKLVNQDQNITQANNIDVEEKHITVIKKTPAKPMGMELKTFRDPAKIYTGVIHVEVDDDTQNTSSLNVGSAQADMYNFSGVSVGDEINIEITEGIDGLGNIVPLGTVYHWQDGLTGWQNGGMGAANIEVGTKIVLKEFDDQDDPPALPITDYTIKGEIVDAQPGNSATVWSNAIKMVITSIDGFPPTPDVAAGQTELQYAVDLWDTSEKLFEFKFPRFSYRYKYEDGEYSPFAPFTQVAFSPGAFDYHPRKGYNLGMTNRVHEIYLSRFLHNSIPKDIVSVDILFKDEPSTAIYVVDTLKPTDEPLVGEVLNQWDTVKAGGSYLIKKETVNTIVPENQLLRPWDNVPRKALAQDITGNRIVYANYVQNYDLTTALETKYYANFKTNWDRFETGLTEATKSIKSLREYQLGVVFSDKYGRETPVISNSTGTMKLDKSAADDPNRIKVGLRGGVDQQPSEMTYMKFFVKETASEYYNLAMDRWYHAEDSNIWLSFPSSDRNKIDIDSFLILKKGSDQDTLVEEEARYKVLAIESEAPDFIKTKPMLASEKTHYYSSSTATGSPLFEVGLDDAPLQGRKEFKVLYNLYKDTPGRNIHKYTDGDLYVEFGHISEEERSKRYKIASISCSVDLDNGGTMSSSIPDTFSILLEEELGADVNFITDDPNGIMPNEIIDGTIVRFYKYETLNLPQFDGRFFVKIYMDDVFRANIEKSFKGQTEYRISAATDIYYLNEDWFEQLTMHMDWWFTPGYQHQKRNSGNYFERDFKGSRKHNSPSGSSQPYSYSDQYSSNFGHIIQVLYMGPPITNNSPGGANSHNDVWEGALTDVNLIDNTLGNRLRRYGHYGNDKFCASALYHWRFLPIYPNFENTTAENLNENWRECTWNGGDKRDKDNWDALPPNEGGAYYGIGYQWTFNSGGRDQSDNYVVENADNAFYQDELHADVCRDAATFFIDNGRVTGQRTTSNNLAFNSGDLSSNPLHTNNHNCNKSGNASGPKGLIRQFSNTKWRMDLSYGGIYGHNGQASRHGNATHDHHFGIGGWNGATQNDWMENEGVTNIVSKINPGNRFKFKQDPTNTVYSMSPQITFKRWINHSTWIGNHLSTNRHRKRSDVSTMGRNMEPAISHNTKACWQIREITPPIVWDPTEEGEITGSGGSVAGVTLYLPICNSQGNNTTSSVTYGNQSGPDGDEVRIYVKSLTDADWGPSKHGTFTLHEGMALKSFTSDNDNSQRKIKDISNGGNGWDNSGDYHAGNDYLVVKRIKPMKNGVENKMDPQYYELELGGYTFPMQNDDHSWLQGGSNLHFPKVNTIPDTRYSGSNFSNGFYRFVQVGMNGHNTNTEHNINHCGYALESVTTQTNKERIGKIGAVGVQMQFVEEIEPEEVLSENPAIWETEPKETKDLNIYYEATGQIPIEYDAETAHEAFPIGTYIVGEPPSSGAPDTIYYVWGYINGRLMLNEDPNDYTIQAGFPNFIPKDPSWTAGSGLASGIYQATTPSGLQFGIVITDIYNGHTIDTDRSLFNANFKLPWHNCYSFGNGVESNRIRDNFNQPFIFNGVKASTTLEQEYKEERRKYGLIYSGIYNSISGVNNLNQFIQAEKITKDVNPIYGSIQKLHSRDSDLVTLCEDKILKILANKDAVFNADGNTNLTATQKVLGQTVPFSGEYGISTNPESFASEAYRAYFSDKIRGKIMRLSKDGLTPISDYGMKDWFRDNLKLVENTGRIIGSYDDRQDEYHVKLEIRERPEDISLTPKVLTYSEKVKGWVSFKSFIEMQHAVSMGNDYYTFHRGELYKHYVEKNDFTGIPVDRNTFYSNFTESTIDVLLIGDPSLIKTYNTLNYEGSQSKIDKFVSQAFDPAFQPLTIYNDQTIYNLTEKQGWYATEITTNKETGNVKEFIEKEGKWFNNINKFIDLGVQSADTADFTFQGIGIIDSVTPPDGPSLPCPTISLFVQNNQLFIQFNSVAMGVPAYSSFEWELAAPSGGTLASTGPTQQYMGNNSLMVLDTIDILHFGSGTYGVNVTFDWGYTECTSGNTIQITLGCTNQNALGFNPVANVDDGSCIPMVYGCTDFMADNYNPSANVDDGTCTYGGGPSDTGTGEPGGEPPPGGGGPGGGGPGGEPQQDSRPNNEEEITNEVRSASVGNIAPDSLEELSLPPSKYKNKGQDEEKTNDKKQY